MHFTFQFKLRAVQLVAERVMEKATNLKKEHKNMFIWVVEIYKYTYMPFEAGDSKVVNNK